MSDFNAGPGWWQASDGKWYSPQQAPQQPYPVNPPPFEHAPVRKTSGCAIASMTLGIVGQFIPCLGALLATIFGHVALHQIKGDPTLKGRRMALAGVILGWLGIVFWLLTYIALSNAMQ